MKIKNKKELVNFISKLKVGDMIELIEIEGLMRGETFRAIDEISRDFNIQLIWHMSYGEFYGEVIQASKKFINKSGQYKMEYSKKVEVFLSEIKTTKEVALENNIPVRTIHNRIESCGLIEGIDYKKLGERQPTLLSPSGIEKILKKS